jgi:radical SAM superfamily enzyme YgiQ (UPF0313 family)
MQMMVDCNFGTVFLGIETPDEDSLALTLKFQNTRDPLSESVLSIARTGLRVMAGFIIGFDGEKSGAGQRVCQFVEQTAIPTALFSMLQALPDTALWHRLEKEGRLLGKSADINQVTLMNFVPTRPIEEIAQEYVEAFTKLYEPLTVLNRTYRHFLMLGEGQKQTYQNRSTSAGSPDINWVTIRALLILCWRQGLKRNTRFRFWTNLIDILWRYPHVAANYLSVCAQAEHFIEFRQIVQEKIEAQVQAFLEQKQQQETRPSVASPSKAA